MPPCVFAGHRNGLRREVRRNDTGRGQLPGERHRDRAASRSDIENPQTVSRGAEEPQHLLDEAFGLRPRDQNPGAHLEAKRPELFLPDDVGNRFAPDASSDPASKPVEISVRKLPVRVHAEL